MSACLFDFDELDELDDLSGQDNVSEKPTSESLAGYYKEEIPRLTDDKRHSFIKNITELVTETPPSEEPGVGPHAEHPDSQDSDDGLSEVWPGDCLDQDLDASQDLPAPDEAEHADSDDDEQVWEVVFQPRIVIRVEPQLDADVIGIGSTQELFFGACHGEWVKLSQERGYILKDGRIKDPKLGMLLQRFSLGVIPASFRRPVFVHLRDVWVQARGGRDAVFLKPLAIKKLRNTYEEVIELAQQGCDFDLDLFKMYFKNPDEPWSPPAASSGNSISGLAHGPAVPVSPFGNLLGSLTPSPKDSSDKPWSFDAPSLADNGGQVTPGYALSLMKGMQDRRLPSQQDLLLILNKASAILDEQKPLVELRVPAGATLHVVGDLHGQFWDLLNIIDVFGIPSKDHWYLFNGDFVDRGQFSVEVVIALFTWKVALPNLVHLNRGNHESFRMNVLYGFMQEAKQKYSEDIFAIFMVAFKQLPLATVVNRSVFVVHGGLARKDSVYLEEIDELDRRREPDETAPDLMIDLLWSDPMDRLGRDRSPRGAGMLFGPDVTENFCRDNGLTCVIRSHEMKYEGFEWKHNQRCLTVFSAANYCGICGNFGAVCVITPRPGAPKLEISDLTCRQFEASPHPNEQVGPQLGFGFWS